MEARWRAAIVCVVVQSPEKPCPENFPRSPKGSLALAIAGGSSASKWAAANQVPKRTAQKWAREPNVRAEVERIRRRALDQAVGVLAKRVTRASHGIVRLSEKAVSESVRLSALRAIFADMMAVSKFGGLEDRMTELEEQYGDRT
jgi:hypothetical protein